MGHLAVKGVIVAYQYERIDGQRVEKNVAAAYRKLEAAFKAKFGLDLLVTSGTRTAAEQRKLRNDYLAGRGGLAAPVGRSNHEEGGPRGPRALDVRDSGRDAGVTRAGSTRAKWLRANASKYGFNPAGYGFSQVEPWHIEFTGTVGKYAAPASNPKPASKPSTKYHTATVDDLAELKGNVGGFQKIAHLYGYNQRNWLDFRWGPGTRAGMQKFLDRHYGGSLAAWLRKKWGYKGNDQWGPVMRAAAIRAEVENYKAL